MSSDRIKDQDGKDKTATTNQAIKSSKASQIAIWLLLGGAIVIAALVFASWFFGGERIPDYVGYPLEGEQKEAVIEQNSPLTDYVYLTANADFPRSKPISKITITIWQAIQDSGASVIALLGVDVQASANYGIDSEGNVGTFCRKKTNRAWTKTRTVIMMRNLSLSK